MQSIRYIFAVMNTYGENLERALSTQIRVEMVDRGMEQQELAEKVGINRVTMNRYLKNHSSMPMPIFFKVAEALGLSPREMMQRAEARLAQ